MKRAILFCLMLSCCMTALASPMPQKAVATAASAEGGEERVTRFLLLGCDRASGLTDSIILASVNETRHAVTLLQIPRDTYAEYTDRDYKKLNGAMQALGADGVKDFLSEAIGLPIHYFVVLRLDCFCALVDAVGGVDVDIPQDMHYSDPVQDLTISLSQGPAHLNGREAEQFVRYRSGYANADLGRLDAQKLFLRAFAKQCKTLTPAQMLRIIGTAICGVQTDIDLPAAIRVMRVLLSCDPDATPMQTLAGQAAKGKSGAWYYILNREGVCEMLRQSLFVPPSYSSAAFDPGGLFDREQNDLFHRIYRAVPEQLPLFE